MTSLLLGVVALILAGCFSPQTHYYSLSPVESAQPISVSGPPLQVLRVTIPPILDRESLVEWGSSGELRISGRNRWAAPLDEMIQNVLAADLRHKLPGLVFMPGDPIPAGTVRGIVINIRQFAANNSRQVVLAADWSLMPARSATPILTRSETVRLPVPSNRSSDVVPVMSEALATLADRMASTIYAETRIIESMTRSNDTAF